MTHPLHTVRQVAYVVRDMEQALKYWTEYLRAGPFFILEHAPLENQKYRGGVSNADVSIALGNSCLLYTSPSPRDGTSSRMPSAA